MVKILIRKLDDHVIFILILIARIVILNISFNAAKLLTKSYYPSPAKLKRKAVIPSFARAAPRFTIGILSCNKDINYENFPLTSIID